MLLQIRKHKVNLNLNQIIAIAFLGIIIIGTFFLSLGASTKGDGSCGILTALFTATSAVCVTGLSVVDVYTSFSFFGQLVILILMEIGGLGFMSIVSVIVYITKHHNNVQALSLMAESVGSDTLKDITRIQKRLLIGALIFESFGALILTLNFIPSMGTLRAVWFGIFHSVSAFCNAGFDLMGYFSPGIGLSAFQNDPQVLMTIAFLIVVGGIGFVVWDDIASSKHVREWSIYTKIALTTTMVLITVGSLMFFILEYGRDISIGNMSLADKITNSIFQAVTTRTAGFASIDQGSLSGGSIALTTILMWIGGSTGSTAGGIKTVTFAIIMKAAISSVFGRKNITIFKRKITQEQIINAYTIANCFIFLSIIGGFIVNATSNVTFIEGFFESVSAIATVGLSLGVTGRLSAVSLLVLIVFMYIGRVGLLTLTLGFFKTKENTAIKYPQAKLLIG